MKRLESLLVNRGDTSWLLAAVGMALLVVGVFGYFNAKDSNVTVALITAGFLFVYTAKIVDRSEGETEVGLTGIKTKLAARVKNSVITAEAEPKDSMDQASLPSEPHETGKSSLKLSRSALLSLRTIPPPLAVALGRRLQTSLAELEFQAVIPGGTNLPATYQAARFGDYLVVYRPLTGEEAPGTDGKTPQYLVLAILRDSDDA